MVFYFVVLQPKQAGKFNIYFYVFDLIFLFFNFTITVWVCCSLGHSHEVFALLLLWGFMKNLVFLVIFTALRWFLFLFSSRYAR